MSSPRHQPPRSHDRRPVKIPQFHVADNTSAREATLPAAGVAPGPRLEPGQTRFFWIVLVGAVAVLLLFVVHLLRKRGEDDPASP